MISNIRTNQLEGTAVVWDGTNVSELQELAGDAFAGVHSAYVLVRAGDGDEPVWVQNGWTIARLGGLIRVFSPDAANLLLQEVQGNGGVVA